MIFTLNYNSRVLWSIFKNKFCAVRNRNEHSEITHNYFLNVWLDDVITLTHSTVHKFTSYNYITCRKLLKEFYNKLEKNITRETFNHFPQEAVVSVRFIVLPGT